MTAGEKYLHSPPGREIFEKWSIVSPQDHVDCPICRSQNRRRLFQLAGSSVYKCHSCGFRYVSPILSKNQLAAYYSNIYSRPEFQKDFEGRKHDVFSDQRERDNKIKDRHVEIEVTREYTTFGKILDVGSGSALYFEGLGKDYDLFGIEMSARAAEYSRRRFGATVMECDIADAEFEPDSFDVVNMTYVIEHLRDPAIVIQKVLKWLKPRGLFLVSSPNWGSGMSVLYREFFRLNDPLQHICLWDRRSLTRFINANGCQVRRVHYPYFKTEYFNSYEIKRLFRNTAYRLLLPLLMQFNYFPHPEKVLSPPFWGNIMVAEAYKE